MLDYYQKSKKEVVFHEKDLIGIARTLRVTVSLPTYHVFYFRVLILFDRNIENLQYLKYIIIKMQADDHSVSGIRNYLIMKS